MTNRSLLVSCLLAGVLFVGCSSQPAAKADQPAQTPPVAQGGTAPGTEGATAAPGGSAASVDPSAPQKILGTVLETMNAGNYTYVRVKSGSADVWAATAPFKVAVGDRVIIPLEMAMQNFESKSLKRTFPLIYFVSRISHEGEAAAPVESAAPPMMAAHAATGGTPPTNATPEPVGRIDPAPGGMTVGDVWAKRKTLVGKSVTVRGKVVKFNGGIMGRNWIHIQDGTGSSKDGTHDLALTSDAPAKLGDIVTVTGKAALDKDFGAGYFYAVILEGATIVLK